MREILDMHDADSTCVCFFAFAGVVGGEGMRCVGPFLLMMG